MIVFKFLGRMLLLGILTMPVSCVRDLDLNQTDKIAVKPRYDLDLFHLSLNQDNFVSNGDVKESQVHQFTHLDFIHDKAVQQDLKQVDFYFVTVNTFTQGFQSTFRFLDSSGNETYVIDMNVPGSGPDGSPQEYTYRETLTGDGLKAFKTSVNMDITATITQDGQPVKGNLKFKSKALFYFEF